MTMRFHYFSYLMGTWTIRRGDWVFQVKAPWNLPLWSERERRVLPPFHYLSGDYLHGGWRWRFGRQHINGATG